VKENQAIQPGENQSTNHWNHYSRLCTKACFSQQRDWFQNSKGQYSSKIKYLALCTWCSSTPCPYSTSRSRGLAVTPTSRHCLVVCGFGDSALPPLCNRNDPDRFLSLQLAGSCSVSRSISEPPCQWAYSPKSQMIYPLGPADHQAQYGTVLTGSILSGFPNSS
jgi:hypothetical protein